MYAYHTTLVAGVLDQGLFDVDMDCFGIQTNKEEDIH